MRKHIKKIPAFLTGSLFILNTGTMISFAQETETVVTTAESESTTRVITTGTTPPWEWKTQTSTETTTAEGESTTRGITTGTTPPWEWKTQISTETTSAETSTETSYIRTTPFAVMSITNAPETISAGEEKIALFNMVFVSKVDLESDNPYLTAELDADLNSSISTDNKIIIRCAENAPAGKAVITYTYRHQMTGETGTGTIELNILASEPQTVPVSSETTSATTTVTTTATATAFSGDANSDGQIDILDVITMNKAILGKETLSETQLRAIDFNGNGRPDSEETLTLMKYIVRLIDTLTK